MVSISSIKTGIYFDDTCLLAPGCHAFVKKDSWIDYSTAEIVTEKKLVAGVEKALMHERDPLSSEDFVRVCRGLVESPHTRRKFITFYFKACGQ